MTENIHEKISGEYIGLFSQNELDILHIMHFFICIKFLGKELEWYSYWLYIVDKRKVISVFYLVFSIF